MLVATGAAKAAPIARAVEGPLTAMCPASVLQLHPHATVVVDEAAAAGLRLADYYREVFAAKPAWQGSVRLEALVRAGGRRRRHGAAAARQHADRSPGRVSS